MENKRPSPRFERRFEIAVYSVIGFVLGGAVYLLGLPGLVSLLTGAHSERGGGWLDLLLFSAAFGVFGGLSALKRDVEWDDRWLWLLSYRGRTLLACLAAGYFLWRLALSVL